MPAPLIKPLTADDVPHLIDGLVSYLKLDAVTEQLIRNLFEAVQVRGER